jgi:hypothetical protein
MHFRSAANSDSLCGRLTQSGREKGVDMFALLAHPAVLIFAHGPKKGREIACFPAHATTIRHTTDLHPAAMYYPQFNPAPQR